MWRFPLNVGHLKMKFKYNNEINNQFVERIGLLNCYVKSRSGDIHSLFIHICIYVCLIKLNESDESVENMHLIIQIHTHTHSIGINYEEKECQRNRHEEIWYMIRIILIISMRWRLIGSGFFLSPIFFFLCKIVDLREFLIFPSSCLPKIGRMSNSLVIFEFTVIRNMHRKFIIFHELNAFNRKPIWTLHQGDARTMCLPCSVASWYWCA